MISGKYDLFCFKGKEIKILETVLRKDALNKYGRIKYYVRDSRSEVVSL